MNRRVYPNPITLCLSLCLMLASAPLLAEPLTQARVQNFLEQMETASIEQDLPQIEAMLARGARIIVTVHSQGQQEQVQLTRQEFLQSMQDSWNVIDPDHYDYQLSDTKIDIAEENALAEVYFKVHEKLRIEAQTLTVDSQYAMILQDRAGRLQITDMHSQIRM